MNIVKSLKRLDKIIHPELNEDNWQKLQPCKLINAFGKEFILTQPASTFLVYLLGIQTLIIGLLFFQNKPSLSQSFWGISLILWGVGALVAGTSYQALGYYIKCFGRAKCRWTSYWEITYLIMQQLSVNAMLVAVSIEHATGLLKIGVLWVAAIISVFYSLSTLYWATVPKKYFLSFEYMIAICAPLYLFLTVLNGINYLVSKSQNDFDLFIAWISLFVVMGLYFVYMKLSFTEKLWKKGIWFSDNDVLHVGLIIWMTYIYYMNFM